MSDETILVSVNNVTNLVSVDNPTRIITAAIQGPPGPAGPGSNITSVFGRIGVVVGAYGDYTASQIVYDPTGTIIVDNVQDAIDVLDDRTVSLQSQLDGLQPHNINILDMTGGTCSISVDVANRGLLNDSATYLSWANTGFVDMGAILNMDGHTIYDSTGQVVFASDISLNSHSIDLANCDGGGGRFYNSQGQWALFDTYIKMSQAYNGIPSIDTSGYIYPNQNGANCTANYDGALSVDLNTHQLLIYNTSGSFWAPANCSGGWVGSATSDLQMNGYLISGACAVNASQGDFDNIIANCNLFAYGAIYDRFSSSGSDGYIATARSGLWSWEVAAGSQGLTSVLGVSNDGGNNAIINVAYVQINGGCGSPITVFGGNSGAGYVLTDPDGSGNFYPEPAGGSQGLCSVLENSQNGGNYSINNIGSLCANADIFSASTITSYGDITSNCGTFINQGQAGITGDYGVITSISIRGGIITAIS